MLGKSTEGCPLECEYLLSSSVDCSVYNLYSWRSQPWYSAEPKNMYERIRNRLMVAIGWISELPGPKSVTLFPFCMTLLYLMRF